MASRLPHANADRRIAPRTLPSALAFAIFLLLTPSATKAQLTDEDAVVVDPNPELSSGLLVSVNRSTGFRRFISDFSDGAQGPLGITPSGLGFDASGNILVADADAGTSFAGALFRVNPASGVRTLLSDFGNPTQGPIGASPVAVALENSGSILVIDSDAQANGALFRVDASNGNRSILSDFSDAAQGTVGADPFGLALDASGNILVVDLGAGTGSNGALFRVNRVTGSREVVSDFGNGVQGPLGIDPRAIAIDAAGNILIIDEDAGTPNGASCNFGCGALFSVNPVSNARTLVSDFGNEAQGALGDDPTGIAREPSGDVLVITANGGTGFAGGLFRVDVSNGRRTLVSDFGDTSEGTTGVDPFAVAISFDATGCGGRAATSGCTVNGVANQLCVGTSGDDTIIGTTGADVITGLAGRDTISGAPGADIICGGTGRDTLMGGRGQDQIFGQRGDDHLRGGRGNDTLDGGDGNDTCTGGAGTDTAVNCESVNNVP